MTSPAPLAPQIRDAEPLSEYLRRLELAADNHDHIASDLQTLERQREAIDGQILDVQSKLAEAAASRARLAQLRDLIGAPLDQDQGVAAPEAEPDPQTPPAVSPAPVEATPSADPPAADTQAAEPEVTAEPEPPASPAEPAEPAPDVQDAAGHDPAPPPVAPAPQTMRERLEHWVQTEMLPGRPYDAKAIAEALGTIPAPLGKPLGALSEADWLMRVRDEKAAYYRWADPASAAQDGGVRRNVLALFEADSSLVWDMQWHPPHILAILGGLVDEGLLIQEGEPASYSLAAPAMTPDSIWDALRVHFNANPEDAFTRSELAALPELAGAASSDLDAALTGLVDADVIDAADDDDPVYSFVLRR